MTQFEEPNPYMADFDYEPQRTSGLAITALVLSILGIVPCCGLVSAPIGLVLGVIAFITIGSRPHLKGRGIAFSAIIIGVIMCVLWGSIIAWGYENISRPQAEGPREAFAAGFAGNPVGFREQFFGDAAAASDEEIAAFIAELQSRYGDYVTMGRDEAAFRANPPKIEDLMQPVQEMPYEIEFTQATVRATIESAAADPDIGEFFWRTRFRRIVIHDTDRGDIVFPPKAQP